MSAKAKKKVVASFIKLVVGAGVAKPAPPVGPALGQAGLNTVAFCKDFNARTADFIPNTPIPVSITAYSDKTYELELKTPPVTYFVKKALGLASGSQRPEREGCGVITGKQIFHIALVKAQDQPHIPLESLCRSIVGTCRSMGVRVVPRLENTPG